MLTGARKQIRRIIWYDICIFVTSVVSLVISPAVLNLSMLANEKVCMFSNMACLKFFAKPVDALAPYLPPSTPQKSPQRAAAIITAPTA